MFWIVSGVVGLMILLELSEVGGDLDVVVELN